MVVYTLDDHYSSVSEGWCMNFMLCAMIKGSMVG
jgi:hypothetical protein